MAKYAPKAPGVSRDALRRAEKKAKVEEGKRSAAPGDKNLIQIREPAARLEGGPRDGWVYYVSDLVAQRRTAEYFDREFDYAPTRKHVTLPWTGGIEGVVWRWTG